MEARGAARLRAERRRALLAAAPALGVLTLLFGGALAGAARTSLVPLGGEPTLDAWRALYGDPAFADSVRFTLQVTLLSTLLSCALAMLVALVMRRRSVVVRALLSLPVPVPHLLVAVAAVLWLAPGGLADRALGGLPLTLVRDDLGLGVVLVYVYKETPFLVLLLLAAMGEGLAAREEAAAVHGASQWQRLRWVVWPAVRTPLVVGGIVVAAFVLGAFEVPLTIGPSYPPTLSEFALQATQGDLLAGEGVAAATLLLTAVASTLLAILAVRLAKDAAGG